jgi:Tfp pilus assembly protein PilX
MKKQQGITLYLSLIIMVILLSLALGINSIFLGQTKIVQDIGESVFAFVAAETGIERELYENNTTTVSYSGSLGASSYTVQVIAPGSGNCPVSSNNCIKSVGTYKITNRAIYIKR